MDDDKRDDANGPSLPATTKRRRRFSPEQKREMVAETLTGALSVSQVARRHDVNANQLFRWCKQYREGRLPSTDSRSGSEGLLPVVMATPRTSDARGILEIDLGNGRRLSISGSVDAALLRVAIEALR